MKRIFPLLAFFLFGLSPFAVADSVQEEEPALTRKEIILGRLAVAQQEEMKTNSRFLKQSFPNLLKNAPIVSQYTDLESFKQAEGARADEILSQTNSDMARVEQWLTQINNYYKKEYTNDMAVREALLSSMSQNTKPEKPPYSTILPGKQIIFLWEEGGHSIPETIDTALELITEVKESNPGKRILLAAEQLVWLEVEPFQTSPLLTGQTDYHAPIVYFAGEAMPPNMTSALRYEDFWDQVNKMGVDILNLHDRIVDQSWLYSFFKVGNISIPSLDTDAFGKASYRFDSNFYGIFQRNSQWNYYIRMVAPYYDVIVVFAGGAHYGLKRMLNMPADKVLDVFIRKLTVDDEAKKLKKMALDQRSDYDDQQEQSYQKRDEEFAKMLSATVYNQKKENGQTSAIYIVIP